MVTDFLDTWHHPCSKKDYKERTGFPWLHSNGIRLRISKTTEIDGSRLWWFESSVKSRGPSVLAGVDIGGDAGAATRQGRQ